MTANTENRGSQNDSQRTIIRSILRPVGAVTVGLLLVAVFIGASGYNVPQAFSALFIGATGLQLVPFKVNMFPLAQSLAQTAPLLFTGAAIAFALRAGLFNIGAQGQMVGGALATAVVGAWEPSLYSPLHIALCLVAGGIAGGLVGALAGLLKAYRHVHEVLSTIMLNYILADAADYLVTNGLKEQNSMAPQTVKIAHTAYLSPFVSGSGLNAGLLLAFAAAIAVALLIKYTALGFRIRAVGENPDAASASGINVPHVLTTTMFISGFLAGLAGAVLVLGLEHRYIKGMTGTYGFDGISVALLGGASSVGVSIAALFFGGLTSGAGYMSLQTNVPDSIAVVVQAAVVLFAGARALPWRRRQNYTLKANAATIAGADGDAAGE